MLTSAPEDWLNTPAPHKQLSLLLDWSRRAVQTNSQEGKAGPGSWSERQVRTLNPITLSENTEVVFVRILSSTEELPLQTPIYDQEEVFWGEAGRYFWKKKKSSRKLNRLRICTQNTFQPLVQQSAQLPFWITAQDKHVKTNKKRA